MAVCEIETVAVLEERLPGDTTQLCLSAGAEILSVTFSNFQQVCKGALDAIVVMNRDRFQYEPDIISSLEAANYSWTPPIRSGVPGVYSCAVAGSLRKESVKWIQWI